MTGMCDTLRAVLYGTAAAPLHRPTPGLLPRRSLEVGEDPRTARRECTAPPNTAGQRSHAHFAPHF